MAKKAAPPAAATAKPARPDNRTAWIVEWHLTLHDTGFKEHELRPYILPYRWQSERVFDFMRCLFWNSALFSPNATLRGINKPYSWNKDPNSAYMIHNGARLFYGLLGDVNRLVAGQVKDLSIIHDSDRYIVRWTRPAGSRHDDVSGCIVPEGAPVERQWIWKQGEWFCDPHFREKSSNLPLD
jgi:hypothetical protein